MKTLKTSLLFLSILLTGGIYGQVTFTLVPSLCAGGTATVNANTGTLSAVAYTWASSPSGPVFSSSSSASTTVTFPLAGTYTVGIGILTSTGFSYATNTIVINPSPSLTVSASAATLCAGKTTTLTASGASSYTWSPSASLNNAFNATVVASPALTTNYTVTGSNGSCASAATLAVGVTTIAVSITPSSTSLCAGFMGTLTAFGATSYTWTGTTMTTAAYQQSLVTGPGGYSVVGSSNGCRDSAHVIIFIAAPINISISQSSQTTCITSNLPVYSKPVHLTATGASIYVWLPPSISNTNGPQIDVRPSATMCYTVIGFTSGCSGSAAACVSVVPQFSASISPPLSFICLGESTPLSVINVGPFAAGPVSAYTYSWTEALNAPPVSISSYFTPTVSVFPQNTTTYTLEVWDAVNCVSLPRETTITVNPCTGLDKLAEETSFQLYPNPAKDKLILRVNVSSLVSIKINNIAGELLFEKNRLMTANEADTLTVDSLPSGVYFVTVSIAGNSPQVRRIIKE